MRHARNSWCAFLLYLAVPALALGNCPVERGQVKNLADRQAADAFASPLREFTVADLAAMPSRPKKLLLEYDTKRFPEELFHLHVQAILVGFKLEADGDYHLVLADLEDPRETMIAEIPSPDCITMDLQRDMWALRKAFDDAFGKPTSKYKKARPGTTVSVEGILFRDFAHKQTGAAPSQTEIHPVLSLERRTVKLPADSAWASLGPPYWHCDLSNNCELVQNKLAEDGKPILTPLGCFLAKTRITWIFGDRVAYCKKR